MDRGFICDNLEAAQRKYFQSSQENISVLVDGTIVGVLAGGTDVDTLKPSSSSYQSYTTEPFTVTSGVHTITFEGLNRAGSDNTILLDQVSIIQSKSAAGVLPGTVQVNLASSYNRVGLVTDGSTFAGGLDGYGDALTANFLGTSLTWSGAPFTIGAANTNDVVAAKGQTISLPQGRDLTLELLATAVNGAQQNQKFIVTYKDGTTATFTVSLSDWCAAELRGRV